MLEVRDLQLVVAIVEEGGITRAGHRLHLSQSALSHQLRELEGRLGTALFWRRSRRMLLTPAGEQLLAGARPVLAQLGALEAELTGAGEAPRELVRLSTECYTCYQWLPAVLRTFGAAHPDVEVRVVAEATRRPLPALLAGELDVAVVSSRVENQKLQLRPLFRDEVVAVVSPRHRLARRAHVTAEDFRGEHLITYSVNPEESQLFTHFLRPAGVSPARVSRVELTEAILEMVKADLGIAVLASWALPPGLAGGALKAVRLTSAGLYRRWSVATLASRRPPAALEAFVRTLSAALKPGVPAPAGRRTAATS